MATNITALKKAMEELTNSHESIVYSVFDSGLVAIYINFKGQFAKNNEKASSANWWRSINFKLEGIERFYYEVGVTWEDEYGEHFIEKSSSYNFPQLNKPRHVSYSPPSGGLRNQ